MQTYAQGELWRWSIALPIKNICFCKMFCKQVRPLFSKKKNVFSFLCPHETYAQERYNLGCTFPGIFKETGLIEIAFMFSKKADTSDLRWFLPNVNNQHQDLHKQLLSLLSLFCHCLVIHIAL